MKKLLLGLLLTSGLAYGKVVVKIEGIMDDSMNFVTAMLMSQQESTIVINSPGGIFDKAEDIISAMKGKVTRCYGVDEVSSAALAVFSQCTYRYSLSTTVFMLHRMFVMFYEPTSQTRAQLVDTIRMLDILQAKYDKYVRKTFIIKDKVYNWLADHSSLLTAEQLNTLSPGYITIVKEIPE